MSQPEARREPSGSLVCPICGRDQPHHHSEMELEEYRGDQLATDDEIEAAVLAAPRDCLMTRPEWRTALAAAFAAHAARSAAMDGLAPAPEQEPLPSESFGHVDDPAYQRGEITAPDVGERFVEMACCGFRFSAVHEDTDRKGWSCPTCAPRDSDAVRSALTTLLGAVPRWYEVDQGGEIFGWRVPDENGLARVVAAPKEIEMFVAAAEQAARQQIEAP